MEIVQALEEMKAYISKFPHDVSDAYEIGNTAVRSFNISDVNKVLIVGLGGSGIGARICQNLVYTLSKAPITVIGEYDIPAWVDNKTLLIAVSYSGNTEETLSAYNAAKEKGANIACITSGGRLEERATRDAVNIIKIPGGQPPRTTFGFNAAQLLFILEAYKLLNKELSSKLPGVWNLLLERQGDIKKLAEKISGSLVGSLPVIYSGPELEGVVVRFRQQINENSKMLCWHHVIPEMNHNELVGWADDYEQIVALFFTSGKEHPKVMKRLALTRDLISKKCKDVIEIKALGANNLEQAYYLIHLGDWISYYLAEKRSVDPIEIRVIDYLKTELAKQ